MAEIGTVTVTKSDYEFKPWKLTDDIKSGKVTDDQLSQLNIAHLNDPQHYCRQIDLDQANFVQSLKPGIRHLFSIRNYWRWDSHYRWNPYKFPVVGPQWDNSWHPNEHDKPDVDFDNIGFWRGHMSAAGWKMVDTLDGFKNELPYLFHFSRDKPWKTLNPFEYRPYAWTMQVHDRNWRNRLADYQVNYAKWVESQLPGRNFGFMVSITKSSHYWSVKQRRSRINDQLPPPLPAGQQRKTASILEFQSRHNWKFNIDDDPDGSHIAYPRTNQVQWLYGLCSILGKLRYRLDRAGLKNWQVVWDMEYMWWGSNWNSLVESCGDDEEIARDAIRINLLKAASNCDAIIWPEPDSRMTPWMLELQNDMAERTTILKQVYWPS